MNNRTRLFYRLDRRPILAMFIALLFFLGVQTRGGAGETSVAPKPGQTIFSKLAWLKEAPYFNQSISYAAGVPPKNALGTLGVGNSHIFALMGLDMPQNRLSNLVGPTYEKSEEIRFFDVWNEIRRGDKHVKFDQSHVFRAKGTGIVVTTETASDLELSTVTFAPPGEKVIVRFAIVANKSGATVSDAVFSLVDKLDNMEAAPLRSRDLVQEFPERVKVTSCDGGAFTASKGRMDAPIGNISAGKANQFVCYIAFGASADEAIKSIQGISAAAERRLLETRDFWRGYLGSMLTMSSDNPFLNEMVESVNVLLKTQEAAETGAIAPMAKYSGSWCRDSFGPVRYLLLTGRFDTVKRILRFYDLATRLIGFRNRYPLDLDLSRAPQRFNWKSVTPQQGDDPNLLILQYYWYYRATGDRKIIEDGYGFLWRNLLGQDLKKDYLFPFHGDETYQVFVMMTTQKPMAAFYSADSGFLFALAAQGLSEMAGDIGDLEGARKAKALAREARETTEGFYWDAENNFYQPFALKETLELHNGPFADINLHPLWLHYSPPSDPRMRRNTDFTLRKLWSSSGAVRASSRVSHFTGMIPGYLLYTLKKLGRLEDADRAYQVLAERVFSRLGETAEDYQPNFRWVLYGSAPTPYRPWETAINAEAALYYLTGLEFDAQGRMVTLSPRLPQGTKRVNLSRIHAGATPLDISMGRSGSTLMLRVRNRGNAAIHLTVRMPTRQEKAAILLNGRKQSVAATHDADWDRKTIRVKLDIPPSGKVTMNLPEF